MGGGVGGSLNFGSSSGVLGPLSPPSTCGIPSGVAGVTGDLLLLLLLLNGFQRCRCPCCYHGSRGCG